MPDPVDDLGHEGQVDEGPTHHGASSPRGLTAVPKSPLFEGSFSRAFRPLPIWKPPRLQRFNDPNAPRSSRTPRDDLDCLYGRGPADSPYVYLPRNEQARRPRGVPAAEPGEFTLADRLEFAIR